MSSFFLEWRCLFLLILSSIYNAAHWYCNPTDFTWPSSDLYPASTDTGIYTICSPTENERSVTLDRLLGTLYLTVSRTMHCLCLTLEDSSNISTSRPTSTLSAFEVFNSQCAVYISYLFTYLLQWLLLWIVLCPTVWVKKIPCGFLTFSQTDGNFVINFYTPIFTFLSTLDY